MKKKIILNLLNRKSFLQRTKQINLLSPFFIYNDIDKTLHRKDNFTMSQLITHYSVSEIILFIIILAVATKELISFIDWAKNRTAQAVHQSEESTRLKEISERHEDELNEIKQSIKSLQESINLLILSDRDDIKQSLTENHHYFCYKLGSIDDYSLDCMQKRYSHYKEEGGNSFVKTLMEEVRALPRKIEMQNR